MENKKINLLTKEEMEKLSFAELCLYLQEINKIENELKIKNA